MKKISALFMVLTLLLPGLALSEGNPSPEEILAGMTTEQKVAQLLMPAFYYRQNEEDKRVGVTEIYPEMEEMLRKYGYGGIIFNLQNAQENAAAPFSRRSGSASTTATTSNRSVSVSRCRPWMDQPLRP